MNSKLLIVSYSFPPDNVPAAQRPYFMAKYLHEDGLMDNIVLTTDKANSSLGKSSWANLEKLKIVYTENRDAKPALAINPPASAAVKKPGKGKGMAFLKSLSRHVLIPDKGVLWYLKAIKKGTEILSKDPEIKYIFSTSPSQVNHLVARYLSKKFNLKWIADFRDFYYVNGIRESKYVFRKLIDSRIERMVTSKADHVVFIGNDMKKEYTDMYPGIRSCSVIFNGFDENEFATVAPKTTVGEKFVIFYAGSFYDGVRSPFPLLKALAVLVNDGRVKSSDIEVVIAGSISEDLLDQMKRCLPDEMVKFLGAIPRKDVFKYMADADALWLIVGALKHHYMGFPVKGFEYMAAQRHVLLFAPEHSEATRIFNELNCGSSYSIEETESVFKANADAIFEIYNKFRKGLLNQDDHTGKNEALVKYTRRFQAKQLYELLDKFKN